MKATLEFDLNEPEDRQAHLRATKALDLTFALHEVQEFLHNKIRKGNLSEVELKVYDEIQKQFFEIKEDRNISFDELIS